MSDIKNKLLEEASKESFLFSEELKDRLQIDDLENDDFSFFSGLLCIAYYESPSDGMEGELVRFKKTKNETLIGIRFPISYFAECVSCSEFIRFIFKRNNEIIHELDFLEAEESSREIITSEDIIELYISLVESNN